MDLSQQLAQTLLEGSVAMHTSQAPRISEFSERRRTVGTTRGIGLLPAELLLNVVEKIAQRMLRHRRRCLDAASCRALLAEILQRHGVLLHLRDLHDAVTFPAHVTQHQATTPRTSVSTSRPSSSRS